MNDFKNVNPVKRNVYFHLPGLFEFYELYKVFLPLFYEYREYFYDWCEIGSIYGAPGDLLWGGGRVGFGEASTKEVLSLVNEYGISPRLTLSNLLLDESHLSDRKSNELCRAFKEKSIKPVGIIIGSDILLDYLKESYEGFYYVSSTTKVITDFERLKEEVNNPDYKFVVPDFRFNKSFEKLEEFNFEEKEKIEFLVNECCYFGCTDRRKCYESVSHLALGEETSHCCSAPNSNEGYVFSKAMENEAFVGVKDILETYQKKGFSQFKIEGRSLGSAIVLEFLLYYMTKPEYQLKVREGIYLDSSLDLF